MRLSRRWKGRSVIDAGLELYQRCASAHDSSKPPPRSKSTHLSCRELRRQMRALQRIFLANRRCMGSCFDYFEKSWVLATSPSCFQTQPPPIHHHRANAHRSSTSRSLSSTLAPGLIRNTFPLAIHFHNSRLPQSPIWCFNTNPKPLVSRHTTIESPNHPFEGTLLDRIHLVDSILPSPRSRADEPNSPSF